MKLRGNMLKIYLLCVFVLLALPTPVFAVKVKKDSYVPLRVSKKRKVEASLTAKKKDTKRRTRTSSKLAGLHPKAQTKVQAALKEMNRIGVRPAVTSGYRSQAQQRAIYSCARRHHCRVRRGIYGARKPGTSLHEAGLAVDFADVAHGKKRQRRLTRDGRKIVKVMRKHGFKWRYGLKDPAHFELDPRAAGFKSEKAAITAAQRRQANQRWLAKKTVRAGAKNRARRPQA
jgi:LAS superfamily LD-carboxypeptidase LdcB